MQEAPAMKKTCILLPGKPAYVVVRILGTRSALASLNQLQRGVHPVAVSCFVSEELQSQQNVLPI